MSESGLKAVSNPSEMFLTEHYSDSDVLAGLAIAVVIDGSRAFVLEVQVYFSLLNSLLTREFISVPLPGICCFFYDQPFVFLK